MHADTTSIVDQDLFESMVSMRRKLHQHPELSWQEYRTAEQVEAFLKSLGLTPRRIAGTGITAEIPARREGPVVALRADLDALPIVEETGLPFKSQHHGVMHACGHDGHTSMLLGAAALLTREPPTTVVP